MLRNEERYATQSNNEQIPLHELIKINKLFPNESISILINDYKKKNTSKQTPLVKGILEHPTTNTIMECIVWQRELLIRSTWV